MYQLEKLAHEYKEDCKMNNNLQSTLEPYYIGKGKYVCCGSQHTPFRIYNLDEVAYIQAALAIPYNEMLEHINYYYNTMMDEADESFWIEGLCKEYGISGYLFVLRFHAVKTISRSLLKNKFKKIYNVEQTNSISI